MQLKRPFYQEMQPISRNKFDVNYVMVIGSQIQRSAEKWSPQKKVTIASLKKQIQIKVKKKTQFFPFPMLNQHIHTNACHHKAQKKHKNTKAKAQKNVEKNTHKKTRKFNFGNFGIRER